jgi:exodeoxyribonuclease VII large subunit
VADLRAPTPSAAAELVAPDGSLLLAQVSAWSAAAAAALRRGLGRYEAEVTLLLARAGRGAADLGRPRQRVDELDRRGSRAVAALLRQDADRLKRCQAQLRALDPQATLNRGFAVVHKAGKVVSSVAQVAGGDGLVVKVADGGFTARVDAPTLRRARPSRRNGSKSAENARRGEGAVQPLLFT